MLKPKLEIGIIYGHDSNLLRLAEQKIEELSLAGYRVKPVILNQETLLRENDLIFNALKEKFANIDAALVFMTPDDRAISEKECNNLLTKNKDLSAQEFNSRLSLRSRQNVIYELGYVTAIVGENKYRIFCPPEVEIPSDIQGKFTVRNLEPANVENVIEDFVIHNLSSIKVNSFLRDKSYVTDYSNICKNPSNALNEFDIEYKSLDSTDDKLLYLFERIVFDSYFQKRDWWIRKINSLSTIDRLQNLSRDILLAISDYMDAWKPSSNVRENIEDFNKIFNAKERLDDALNEISFLEVNPIVLMVGYDFLGLACNKLAQIKEFETKRQIGYLLESEKALKLTIELAENHDDKILPLWKGFSLFNLARTIDEIVKREGGDNSTEWRKIFHRAIETRDFWRRCHYSLPIEVREGLETEYQHAIADRILRINFDSSGESTEEMPYRYSKDDILRHKENYEQWWSNPNQIRVRLASNVHASWRKLFELNPTVGKP